MNDWNAKPRSPAWTLENPALVDVLDVFAAERKAQARADRRACAIVGALFLLLVWGSCARTMPRQDPDPTACTNSRAAR